MLDDVATPEGAGAGPREINRRTIAKGVAWSVPVIVMATAAPAAAASRVAVGGLTAVGKQGLSGWTLILTITNDQSTSITVELLTLYKNKGKKNLITARTVVVPTGTTSIQVYDMAGGDENKKGDEFILSYSVAGDAAHTSSVTLT